MSNEENKIVTESSLLKKSYQPKTDVGGTAQPKAPPPTTDEAPPPPPAKDD